MEGTKRTRIWFLSSVCSDMLNELIFGGGTIGTVRTSVRLLSGVGSYMPGHAVPPICPIGTEGTLVNLAVRLPPDILRSITVRPHLSGTPILIIGIHGKLSLLVTPNSINFTT